MSNLNEAATYSTSVGPTRYPVLFCGQDTTLRQSETDAFCTAVHDHSLVLLVAETTDELCSFYFVNM